MIVSVRTEFLEASEAIIPTLSTKNLLRLYISLNLTPSLRNLKENMKLEFN